MALILGSLRVRTMCFYIDSEQYFAYGTA